MSEYNPKVTDANEDMELIVEEVLTNHKDTLAALSDGVTLQNTVNRRDVVLTTLDTQLNANRVELGSVLESILKSLEQIKMGLNIK